MHIAIIVCLVSADIDDAKRMEPAEIIGNKSIEALI